jgi:hypothetical protein
MSNAAPTTSTQDLVPVLVLAVAAGAAPVIGVSPLVLPVVLGFALGCLYLVHRPDTALQVAVVGVLVPAGLLPLGVQSGLNAGTIGLAAVATGLAYSASAPRKQMPLAVWLLAAFVFWGLLSIWWSDRPALGFELARRYSLGVVLLGVLVARTGSRPALDRLMDALAVAAWVSAACGVYAVLTGSVIDGRLAVFAMNANEFGNILLLATPGVLWRAMAPGIVTRARVVQAVSFLALALVLIAKSGSRGSLLSFALLLLALLATRTARRWGLAAAAVSVVLVLAFPSVFGTVFDRIRHEDPTQLSRGTLWASGLSLIADHPMGVGLGVGPYAMPAYIDQRSAFGHYDHLPAHNPLIEVGTDTGVVGITLYGSAFLVALTVFIGRVRRAQRWGDRAGVTYGSVVGGGSLAFLLAWAKSGGESYSFAAFLLLGLWLVAAAAREPAVDEISLRPKVPRSVP